MIIDNKTAAKYKINAITLNPEDFPEYFNIKPSDITLTNDNFIKIHDGTIPHIIFNEGFITKVEILGDRVVRINFRDGTSTKSVCNEADKFDFETGITICLLKKLIGDTEYHTTVKKCKRIFKNRIDIENAEKAAEKAKERRHKKNQIRWEKKRAKWREQRIQEQTEAYIRALSILKNSDE